MASVEGQRRYIQKWDAQDPPVEQEELQERMEQVRRASARRIWGVKRVMDVLVSAVMLLALSPLLLVTALYILLDSPQGSPLFTQTRVGLNGRLFKLYKFRTMVPDAERRREELLSWNEMDGPMFKVSNDPRITRSGKFLRRSSIDELPQFFNVLRGDMSLVGPRPPLPEEAAQFTDYQRLKLAVKPGLTCSWQVQPRRNGISFAQWIELDLDYILDCTLWLDFKLMLRTPLAMLRGDGR